MRSSLTAGRGLCLLSSHCFWVSDLSPFLWQLQSKQLRLSAQQAPYPHQHLQGQGRGEYSTSWCTDGAKAMSVKVGQTGEDGKGDRQGEKEAGGS